MKKVISTFVAALALALVPAVPYTSFAQEAPQTSPSSSLQAVVYPAANATKLWMVVDKPTQSSKVRVELVDKANKVLYTGLLPRRSKAYKQQFNLSEMTDGNYTIRITDGDKVVEKTFRLSTPGLNEQLPQRYVTMN